MSAGGFIVAALANGMSPRELCASFIENDSEPSETFDPSWLPAPAYGEFLRRSIMLPGLVLSALLQFTIGRKSLLTALERLGPSLPTGVFSNQAVDTQLARLFSREGRTNDFRKLKTKLTLVATNLDSGEAAPLAARAGTMCPSRRRCRPARHCPDSSRRSRSTTSITWTAR